MVSSQVGRLIDVPLSEDGVDTEGLVTGPYFDQTSACWDGVLLVEGGFVSLLPWQDMPAVDVARPLLEVPGAPVDTWPGPFLAAPVCVGSLDETPDDEALQIVACSAERCETPDTALLRGLNIDFAGNDAPSVIFTLPLAPVGNDITSRVRLDSIGDLDDNGITDLVIIETRDGFERVHVFLGPLEGDLTFADADLALDARPATSDRDTTSPVRVSLGDATGDHIPDLVVAVPSVGRDCAWPALVTATSVHTVVVV